MENQNQSKPKLTPTEAKMVSDFTKSLNYDLKEQLLVMVIIEAFQNNKLSLKRALEYWAGQTLKMQFESVDKMYLDMTPDQKKDAVPVEKYKELFNGSLNAVKDHWMMSLELKTSIITPG